MNSTDFPDCAACLAELGRWVDARWLRPLDSAFARFVIDLHPPGSPLLATAAALLSHMEGRGHSCLDLVELVGDARALLAWPPEAAEALQALLAGLPDTPDAWTSALRQSAVVFAAPAGGLRATARKADGILTPPDGVATPADGIARPAEGVATPGDGKAAPGDGDAHQPLVLDGNRLYLRRYWLYERHVALGVSERASRAAVLDEPGVRRWLDRLFDAPRPGTARPDWQKIACAVALRSHLAIITGGPGTGKTFTVARLLALLFATAPDAQRLRIALAAPTGKAAARLKQSIEDALTGLQEKTGDALALGELAGRIGPARTLHALLGMRSDTRRLRYHAGNPLDIDVLIIDEASMIHLEMMSSVLGALPPHARLVLLGDKDQLASVEAGSVLGDLCRDAAGGGYASATRRYVGDASGEPIPEHFAAPDGQAGALAQQIVMLRESRRFGGPIGALAAAVNAGDAGASARILDDARDTAAHWLTPPHLAAVVGLASGDGQGVGVGDRGRDRVGEVIGGGDGGRDRVGEGIAEGIGERVGKGAGTGAGKGAGKGATEGKDQGYAAYLRMLRERPAVMAAEAHEDWVVRVLRAFEAFRVLCTLREGAWGVSGLNQAIETGLAQRGLLRKRGEWYAGRPVMITRNDYDVGVFNGDIGVALPAADARASSLRVYFSDGRTVRSVLSSRLSDTETAFAITVHKAQGSEFDHTVLVLPDTASQLLARELIYTGITRARQRLTLVCADRMVFTQAVERRTRRASGLYERLNRA